MDSRYEPSLLHSLAEWLDSHAWSRALHESLWVWPLVESGRVRPVVHRRFPLSQAGEAHRPMESSTHVGKLLLVP